MTTFSIPTNYTFFSQSCIEDKLALLFSPPFLKAGYQIHNNKWASELLQWHESEATQFDTKSIMMLHLRVSSEKQLKRQTLPL